MPINLQFGIIVKKYYLNYQIYYCDKLMSMILIFYLISIFICIKYYYRKNLSLNFIFLTKKFFKEYAYLKINQKYFLKILDTKNLNSLTNIFYLLSQ